MPRATLVAGLADVIRVRRGEFLQRVPRLGAEVRLVAEGDGPVRME